MIILDNQLLALNHLLKLLVHLFLITALNAVRNNCRLFYGDLGLRLFLMGIKEIRGRWIGLILGFGMDMVGRVRLCGWVGRI